MANMAFGSTLNPINGKRERLAVSSTVVSFDPDNYTVDKGDVGALGVSPIRRAGGAMCQVTGVDSIYYTVDGTDPAAGVAGFELAPGDIFYLYSYQEVQNFKVLRKTTDTSIEAAFFFGN